MSRTEPSITFTSMYNVYIYIGTQIDREYVAEVKAFF